MLFAAADSGKRGRMVMEAQSVWSVNIIIRALMYLMQTYNEYFRERKANLYSSTKVEMPRPELYVIFRILKEIT